VNVVMCVIDKIIL